MKELFKKSIKKAVSRNYLLIIAEYLMVYFLISIALQAFNNISLNQITVFEVLTVIKILLVCLAGILILVFGYDVIIRGSILRNTSAEETITQSINHSAGKYKPMLTAGILMLIINLPVYFINYFIFQALIMLAGITPALMISGLITILTQGIVGILLFMVYPSIIIQGVKGSSSILNSMKIFLKDPKRVIVLFLIVSFITYSISFITIIPAAQSMISITPSAFSLSSLISFTNLFIGIALIRMILLSFTDLLGLSLRSNYLKDYMLFGTSMPKSSSAKLRVSRVRLTR